MSYHHICDTAVTARAALKCPRGGAARATNARGAAELQTAVISGCTRVSVIARPRLCHGAVKWYHGRCVRACAILHMLRVILSEFIYYIYICVFYSHSWSEGSAAVGSCARAGCADQTSPPPSWPPQPRSTLILLNWRRLPRCCARLARRRDWAFSSSAHDKFSSCDGRKRGSDAWFKDTRAPEASLWRDAHWVRTGFPSPDRTWRETRVIVGFSWMGKSRALMKSS